MIFILMLSLLAMAETDLNTSLMSAARNGKSDEIRELIGRGADVNSRHSMTQWTPITAAAYYGHLEAVQELINSGADVNAVDKNRGTPLMKAITLGPFEDKADIVERKAAIAAILLKAGADPYAADAHGEQIWEMLFVDPEWPIVEVFERAGVKNVLEQHLLFVIAGKQKAEVDRILKQKPDLRWKDKSGADAVYESVLAGDSTILKAVLDAGGPPDSTYARGDTALMIAARYRRADLVKLLLRYGADAGRKNENGETAKSIALLLSDGETLKALE